MKRKENIIDKISLQMMNDEISDEAVIALISENVGDLEMGDRQGRTLLIDAAFYKRQKVMECLVWIYMQLIRISWHYFMNISKNMCNGIVSSHA